MFSFRFELLSVLSISQMIVHVHVLIGVTTMIHQRACEKDEYENKYGVPMAICIVSCWMPQSQYNNCARFRTILIADAKRRRERQGFVS